MAELCNHEASLMPEWSVLDASTDLLIERCAHCGSTRRWRPLIGWQPWKQRGTNVDSKGEGDG